LFGPVLDQNGVTGELAAAEPANACSPITNLVAGTIALVDRGSCSFDSKVLMAQEAGAIGVVVANNREGPLPFLAGSSPDVAIPSVGIPQSDGVMLREGLLDHSVVKLAANEATGVRLVAEHEFGPPFRDMGMPSCWGDPTCEPSVSDVQSQ
jgi:hypothetical protein